ncbi:MAG TPA: pitrilysin family protein [Candidatus Krumholzibacteria bacterium]|nr:pitrilysin family protein [Candidatus Krumholzibacteria bacterium]
MAKDLFPFPVTTRSLDNGLHVVMVPFDSPGIVAYYTIVRAGSRNEVEPGKSGFAHFFEHMMFRGTDRYTSDAFNALYRRIGSDPNAYTSDDVTVYHALVPKDALDKVMDVESDRFMHLKYSESDFKQESKAVLGEYNKNYSDPENKLYEKSRDTAYTTHTYKHTTMGFLADIQDMPNQYDYSREFFRRYYTPGNCVILIVGDFDADKTFALVQKYYSPWKAQNAPASIPAEPEQTEARTAHVSWDNATLPYLCLSFKIPAFSTKTTDTAALDLLASLYFDETSPLYQELVIRDQKVDELSVYAPLRRDPGLFMVFARVKDAAQLEPVRERIYQTVEDAAHTPIDPQRLADVKSNVRYSFAMSLDTARSVASNLTQFIELTGDPESINEMYRRYDEVKPEDLMRVAGSYLTRARSTEVTLTGGAQ